MGEPSKYPGFHHRVSWPKFMGLRLTYEEMVILQFDFVKIYKPFRHFRPGLLHTYQEFNPLEDNSRSSFLCKERLGDYYWVCPDDSKLNIMFDVWLRATHGW